MRPKIMMGGAMYIRMRGVDLIILCLKFAVLRRKIGPNTLSCHVRRLATTWKSMSSLLLGVGV